MEPLGLGAFPDGEWDWYHRIFAIEGQDYLPSQFFNLSSSLLPGDEDENTGMQSMFSSNPESQLHESMLYSFDALNSNFQYISQESSNSSNSGCGYTNNNFCNSDQVLPIDTCTSLDFYMMGDEKNPATFVPSLNDIVIDEENVSLNEDERSDGSEKSDHCQVEPIVPSPNLKRKLDMPALEVPEEDKKNTNSSGGQKKKPRASKDVQRCVKNARSKKNQKPDRSENEAERLMQDQMDMALVVITCNSEDDNANQENSGGATSTLKSPKTRASRGSATDPQSLYARKRRGRINERLRILQSLVPNGTKVDISTMLEEAVHYVKFLQLQIKLLSSDDLWMYAPIAYNGIDIGLNLIRKDYSTAMS